MIWQSTWWSHQILIYVIIIPSPSPPSPPPPATDVIDDAPAPAPPLPHLLWESLSKSLYGPNADATITITSPHEEGLLLYGSNPPWLLTITVDYHSLIMLEEGHWCVLADGIDIMCVGDKDIRQVQVDLTSTILVAMERLPSTSHEMGLHVTLTVVLAGGGLQHPSIQRSSPPVKVRVLIS